MSLEDLHDRLRSWHEDFAWLPPGETPETKAHFEAYHEGVIDLSMKIMSHEDMNQFRCFMVDFVGRDDGAVLPEGAVLEDLLKNHDSVRDFVTQLGGGLAASVRQFIEDQEGLVLSDSGGGLGHWHLGTYCTPGQAWRLFRNGRMRFRRAIEADILMITIKPWSID